MKDLVVQRYNIITVHSNGETFDDLREKPNGMFCYYREANESHKEILAEYSEPVNESLIEVLQLFIDAQILPEYHQGVARAAISKALGEE
ncbi:TPA: hypothetical protein OMS42_002048 [Enterobacter kobei]|nr:hypothetical protein [Enterobacter kobei]